MPKYIIEREIPNAGALSAAELKAISQKSCDVLKQLGPVQPSAGLVHRPNKGLKVSIHKGGFGLFNVTGATGRRLFVGAKVTF